MNSYLNTSFVDKETACLLKQKGFNFFSNFYYEDKIDVNKLIYGRVYQNYNALKHAMSAPLLEEATQWLREVKKIHIVVDYFRNLKWVYSVCRCSENNHDILASGMNYKTYEDALLNGIKDVLKNILK